MKYYYGFINGEHLRNAGKLPPEKHIFKFIKEPDGEYSEGYYIGIDTDYGHSWDNMGGPKSRYSEEVQNLMKSNRSFYAHENHITFIKKELVKSELGSILW